MKKSLFLTVTFLCASFLAIGQSLPDSFDKLDDAAPLSYNLAQKVDFQPVHVSLNNIMPFVVLGRFDAKKKGRKKVQLNAMELAVYPMNTTDAKPKFLAKAARFTPGKNGKKHQISITLKPYVLGGVGETERAKGLAETSVAVNFEFKKGEILDFHIENHDDMLNHLYGSPGEVQQLISGSKHCNGKITYEDSEQ